MPSLYTYTLHYRSSSWCDLDAKNFSDLQRHQADSLRVLNASPHKIFGLINSISVEVNTRLNWLPQSAGSPEIGWTLNVSRVVLGCGELRLNLLEEKGLSDGLRRLLKAMKRLTVVVALYRKVTAVHAGLERYHNASASRILNECKDLTAEFSELQNRLYLVEQHIAHGRFIAATNLAAKCKDWAANSLGNYNVVE